jgi:hypothetical protein
MMMVSLLSVVLDGMITGTFIIDQQRGNERVIEINNQ